MSSVFTKIINNELPCYKIHEDDHTISILTIAPIQLGHTLVISKKEIDHWLDVEDEAYIQVMINAKKISMAIQRATGCKRIGTSIQGWEVPHFHYHLIPMFDPSDINFSKQKERSQDEMKQIADKIKNELAYF